MVERIIFDMSILITNIKKLVQVETKPVHFKAGKQMSELPTASKMPFFLLRMVKSLTLAK